MVELIPCKRHFVKTLADNGLVIVQCEQCAKVFLFDGRNSLKEIKIEEAKNV